jgi:hypothetical protein
VIIRCDHKEASARTKPNSLQLRTLIRAVCVAFRSRLLLAPFKAAASCAYYAGRATPMQGALIYAFPITAANYQANYQ